MRQFQAFFFFLTSMSHFSVLVIGPDPEAQLDPFWELDLPAEELREDYRAAFSVHTPAGKIPAAAAKVLADLETKGHELAPQYRRLLAAGRHEEILQDWFGGDKNAEGDWGYYSNPDAKWDWFVLGGRWHGSLILKPGCVGVLGEGSWWNDQQPHHPMGLTRRASATSTGRRPGSPSTPSPFSSTASGMNKAKWAGSASP